MANKNIVGLVGAALLGTWHVVWSILVASGLAQVLYDFILWAHMVHLKIAIGPFDPLAAVVLIGMTASVGYAMGYPGRHLDRYPTRALDAFAYAFH